MKIEDVQRDFEVWIDRNFPDQTLEQTGLMLGEEAGEVQRCLVKMAQGIRGTREEWLHELGKELGDVLVALVVLAYKAEMNMAVVIEPRLKELLARDWTMDRQGHGLPQ